MLWDDFHARSSLARSQTNKDPQPTFSLLALALLARVAHVCGVKFQESYLERFLESNTKSRIWPHLYMKIRSRGSLLEKYYSRLQ